MGRILALAGCLLLAACSSKNSKTEQPDGVGCFPPAAAPYLSVADRTVASQQDPGGAYTVYLDGSASMAGYIRGGTVDTRLLPELVGMLPELPAIDRSNAAVWRFNRAFTKLDPAGIRAMQTAGGYLCPAANRDCDAQDSYINEALDKIADETSNSLSVIVSDLWLDNKEVLTSNGVAFSKPLARIFASGRSVAVFGFESPYQGRVDDLPSGRRDVTASRRQLFLLVAGPTARLEAFHTAMTRAASPTVGAAMTTGKAGYSIFSLSPALRAAGGPQAFGLEPKSALRKAYFLKQRQGVKLDEFAYKRSAEPSPGARWKGIQPADIQPGAVWRGRTRGTTLVFRQRGETCAPDGADWQDEGKLQGGWSGDDVTQFRLDPEELATLGAGTFLLVGELDRISLQTPNDDSQWLRDWSFSASSESAAVTRPVMPTLNLAELARLLELALLDAAERQPARLGGFAVAVKID